NLAVVALVDLVKVHLPDVVFLIETLADKQKLEEIRVRLKFAGCFSVDVHGRSDRFGFLWKTGMSLI
ncbi:hypothetical protein LINGRAHAP2_LOCUS7987, partial [Linum grandiflorum]